MDPQTRYFIGLDLGQATDYTAMAILRQTWTPATGPDAPANPITYEGVYLQRYALGTPYPAIVADVKAKVEKPELQGYVLCPDLTGVGRPVVDLLRQAGLTVRPVMITGGSQAHEVEDCSNVPKVELVTNLQVLMQNGALRFAAGLPDIQILVDEMQAFKVKVSAAANELYGAWRDGEHDDLVLAVAMAAWMGERDGRNYGQFGGTLGRGANIWGRGGKR